MRWGWILFLCVCNDAEGQFYFYDDKYLDQPVIIEIGANVGLMGCLTDLGHGMKERKGSEWLNGRFCLETGLFFGVKWHQLIGIRFQANFGKVTAADSVLKDVGNNAVYRYHRNLHFRSQIMEASIIGLIYPLGLFRFESPPKVSPYLFAGIGVFHFDPKALLLGQWTSLAPLRTEGNDPTTFYNRVQSNLLAGIGISYEMNARINLMIEGCYRILHTDYLDDISTFFIDPSLAERSSEQASKLKALYALSTLRQGPDVSIPGAIRGNAANADTYFSFRLAVAWTINRQRIN